MIKTIVTPQNNSICLAIPNRYIGKEIEVLLYAKDELISEEVSSKKTMADFTGILSDSDYLSLKNNTDQARQEWNRDI
ncbi:MAG: hypothetical protein IPO21_15440 [Bacteroidales bacterium]|nr:hypothetical protein [Bacteroidales bacterium]